MSESPVMQGRLFLLMMTSTYQAPTMHQVLFLALCLYYYIKDPPGRRYH